jgi:hypothetical protein
MQSTVTRMTDQLKLAEHGTAIAHTDLKYLCHKVQLLLLHIS